MNDKILWGIIDELRDDVNCHIDTITDLQAEIEQNRVDNCVRMEEEESKYCDECDEIKELKAENVRLNDGYIELRKEYNDNYQDLRKKNKELKAELDKEKEFAIETSIKNDMLQAENKRLKGVLDMDSSLDDAIIKDAELIRELQAENNRLVEQVSSKWTNNSNVHTIRGEIAEYMENNDKCGGARLFILPIEDFDGGGICDTCLDWDDGME